MKAKKRIAILGIGGVGGYIGGYLAKQFLNSNSYEIIFIARGEHGNEIAKNGLSLITDEEIIISRPNLISTDANVIGHIDFLICTTKSYDLMESIEKYHSCISNQTIILPLLNGVDSFEKLKIRFPNSKVLNGCIFIVTKIIDNGIIEITGQNHYVCIGSDDLNPEIVEFVFDLFTEAKINVRKPESIDTAVWEKYVFISSLATLTTLKDKTIGQILESVELRNQLIDLMNEVKGLAEKKGVLIQPELVDKNISAMQKMPYETTSSMHRDRRAGKKIELESLSNFVVNLGEKLKVATPAFNSLLKLND